MKKNFSLIFALAFAIAIISFGISSFNIDPSSDEAKYDSLKLESPAQSLPAAIHSNALSEGEKPQMESKDEPRQRDQIAAPVIGGDDSIGLDYLDGISANIKTNKHTYSVKANSVGIFPRIYISPDEVVQVELKIPRANTEIPILLEVEDGGQLMNEGVGSLRKVGRDQRLNFSYQAGRQSGIYRVQVLVGDSVRQLDFWVGEPT